MKNKNEFMSHIFTMILILTAFGCIALAAFVWNFDPDRDLTTTETILVPDTVDVADTLYSISDGYQMILEHCYFLEVCSQRQIVPFEQQARCSGILDEIADVFTDVTLDMYLSVPVEVYAGIDASQIQIIDYIYDEECDEISKMEVFIPRSEITYSMVDLSENPLTHYREGHVRGSMYLITDFLVDACTEAEPKAIDMAIASGLLEEADRACEQEIRILLGSIGVQNVEFVREMSAVNHSTENTLANGGTL